MRNQTHWSGKGANFCDEALKKLFSEKSKMFIFWQMSSSLMQPGAP
jgi:hypothetical protein